MKASIKYLFLFYSIIYTSTVLSQNKALDFSLINIGVVPDLSDEGFDSYFSSALGGIQIEYNPFKYNSLEITTSVAYLAIIHSYRLSSSSTSIIKKRRNYSFLNFGIGAKYWVSKKPSGFYITGKLNNLFNVRAKEVELTSKKSEQVKINTFSPFITLGVGYAINLSKDQPLLRKLQLYFAISINSSPQIYLDYPQRSAIALGFQLGARYKFYDTPEE